MRRERREICVYCRASHDLTVDHVPPRLLLTRPYPPNLITVPACKACNQSFQKDDEYTRTMLAIDVRASENIAAQSKLPAILRSLQRESARGFADYLSRQANDSMILDQHGNPMGQVFELDKSRVNRTGERIIRALHFNETGFALPSDAIVRIGCNPQLRTTDQEFKEIVRVLAAFPERRPRHIGTAFGYLAALGPKSSAWLVQLYDFFAWVGTVDFRHSISDPEKLPS